MEIPLAGNVGKGKSIIVSPCDFERVKAHKWWMKTTNGKEYIRSYDYIDHKQKVISLHRFIMQPKQNEEVDHINGNGLDNRRENLRVCTTAENVRNVPKRKDCKSKYKGTVFVKNLNRWRARIQVNGKRYYSSCSYKTEEEASERFNEMAIQYHGEFARLNFPI